ncbi:MAG TPA: insulinase family protein, partial [Usitatibacter sp.]|nr:insulinase family protein [Usitatibacter sp.]
YYRPNNASLVLAGDIDKAKARALVAHYFGSLKRGAEVPPTRVETPPIAGERRVVIEDRIELPRVYMGWITPPAYQPGDAELDVVAQILGGGKSSRLYKKLVYEMQIAQDVEVSQYSLQLGSVFTVQVTARPGHDAKELEAAIDAELEKLRREGPDAKELERARNTIESALITGVEKLGGLADRMNRYNQYLGDPGYLGKDLERYRILTLEAVRKIAEEQLRKDARVVVYGVPGKQDLGPEVPTPSAPQVAPGTGTEALNAAEEWRRTRPKSGQLAPFKLPVPKSFALANGLKVIVHQRPGLPIVAANLVLKSGSEANPLDKPVLASFTADMLDEGTRSRSATQLAEDIAQLGTTLGTGSNADSSHVEFVVLKKNFAAALDIMADVTLNPAFAPQEIERQRSSRLALLAQVRADPVALVRRATASALYGTKHPFGYLNIGTEGALQATSRDDLRGFWQRHYVPDNAALVVAGDIDADELKALAQQAFGSWQPGRRAAAATPQPRTTSARLVLVDKADAPQSALRIARLGPPRSTPDYAAIAVMNAALGGLFTSRLNNTLREDKGYTYGAASGFRFHRSTGEFEIRTSVRTDVTAPAVGDALKVLEGMHRPMGREEWMRARDSQLRSLPGEFETSASTVNTFAELFSYDLGLDYYRKLPSRLAAVTPNSIQAAARRYLQAQRLVVVVVGDRKKIEDGLRKLNLGAIEYRDADANVVE